VFDKQTSLREKSLWFSDLYHVHYDCVIDLRHTMLPFFLMPKYSQVSLRGAVGDVAIFLKDCFALRARNDIKPAHKKEIHLNRLRQIYDFDGSSQKQYAILTTKEDEQFFEGAVAPALQGKGFVVIAPGAADSAKRWGLKGFAMVADHLAMKTKVVFVGDQKDVEIIDDIRGLMKTPSLSLAGKINLRQLAFILKKCSWAMTHDSGVMHLASYFDVPLVVLWGPTDVDRYAPWSKRSVIVRRNEECVRCRNPKDKALHNCMSFIKVDDVINACSVIASDAILE